MRIAISGTTGLIGASVARQLAARHEIFTVGRRENCTLRVDLAISESLAELNLFGCDAFVHCAGVTDEDFRTDPASAYWRSTQGTAALVQKALAGGAKYFVYFSTAHVYGPMVGRITEDFSLNPLTDYALAHYASEQIVRRYAQDSGLTALVIRPNAVFGIPQSIQTFDRWQLIPYSFPLDAAYRQEIVLKSDGLQRRNFISADDLAGYVDKFFASTEQFNPYTLLNPVGLTTVSVFEFAHKCASAYTKLTGKACPVRRVEPVGLTNPVSYEYASLRFYYHAQKTLEDYLTSFLQKILEDQENGLEYAA